MSGLQASDGIGGRLGGRLGGRVVVVTGAASGIGKAAADAVERAGGLAVRVDRTPVVGGIVADVTSGADWERVLAEAAARTGTVHGLVNAAGIAEAGSVGTVSLEDFRRVMAVNLEGPLLGMQALLRQWRGGAPRGAVMVNISSISGRKPAAAAAAYCVSKAALEMLGRCAALEAAPLGVRVVTVVPGGVRTEMWMRQPWFVERVAEVGEEAAYAELAEGNPMGRLALPEEVAATVVWALSDESGYVTGSEMVVDGGEGV